MDINTISNTISSNKKTFYILIAIVILIFIIYNNKRNNVIEAQPDKNDPYYIEGATISNAAKKGYSMSSADPMEEDYVSEENEDYNLPKGTLNERVTFHKFSHMNANMKSVPIQNKQFVVGDGNAIKSVYRDNLEQFSNQREDSLLRQLSHGNRR